MTPARLFTLCPRGAGVSLVIAGSACGGVLGLDDLHYVGDAATGADSGVVDAHGPTADVHISGHDAADALGPRDVSVVEAEAASHDAGSDVDASDALAHDAMADASTCHDGYYLAVMQSHPSAYFRLSDVSAGGSCANEVSGSQYKCSYSSTGLGETTGVTSCASGARLATTAAAISLFDASGSLDFPGDTPFSLEAWIEVDAVEGGLPQSSPLGSALMPNSSFAPGNGYTLFLANDGAPYIGPRCEMWSNSHIALVSQAGAFPNAATYFHLVLTHQAGTDAGAGVDRIYMNGTVGPYGAVGTTSARPATMLAFKWGDFIGSLGEIAIYDHTLGSNEILGHYNAAQPP